MFQMEMLNSYLLEAPRMKGTHELTNTKQALFTVMYTHERLVLAAGDGGLNPLASLSSLMQYIEKLQMGGERLLKPDELQVLGEAAKQFAQMYDGYGKVLDSRDSVISSQNDKMAKADKALKELLKKKMAAVVRSRLCTKAYHWWNL